MTTARQISDINSDIIDSEIEFRCPFVYCEYCQRDVSFVVRRAAIRGMYHGDVYKYRGKKAKCKECGRTVVLPEIMEYNMRKLVAESKKEKGKEPPNEN